MTQTLNPWIVVNVVFHHLVDSGLHPLLCNREFGRVQVRRRRARPVHERGRFALPQEHLRRHDRRTGQAVDDILAIRTWLTSLPTAPAGSGQSASAWVAASPWSWPAAGFDASAQLRPGAEGPAPGAGRRLPDRRQLRRTRPRAQRRRRPTRERAHRLGLEHDVKEYPDAGHSFLNRTTLVSR